METVDIVVAIDDSREVNEIISEFQAQGARVTVDSENTQVLHVKNCPVGLQNYVEGVLEYATADEVVERELKEGEGD